MLMNGAVVAAVTREGGKPMKNAEKSGLRASVVVETLLLEETRTLYRHYVDSNQASEGGVASSSLAYIHSFTAGTPAELDRFLQYT